MLERLHFTVRVSEMNAIGMFVKERLTQDSFVILVISTTGQGELPANARLLWKKLLRKKLTADHMANARYTTFGLGDSSYPKFNWAARKLHKRLLQLGATEFYPRGEADAQHPEGTDGGVLPWTADLRRHLLETYQLPPGISLVSDDVLLPPKWMLELVDDRRNGAAHSLRAEQNGPSAVSEPVLREDGLDKGLPPDDLLPIPGSFTVTLDENERVTPKDYWQDVRLLTLSTPTVREYQPGDVLAIFPKNFPQDVDSLLSLMDWGDIADKPIRIVAQGALQEMEDERSPGLYLPLATTTTVRHLLTHYLDITAIPRRSFFARIAHFTDDPREKERLLEFTKPEYLDELFDYTTRARRSILEVLLDFQSVKIPWSWIGDVFPILKSRQFSIASGGALKKTGAMPFHTKFQLLVAIVRYRTVIKKVRQGVCSRYLTILRPGTQINVVLKRGGLAISRTEASKPVVLIGPGTGVAPMRSMLWERLSWMEVDGTAPEAPDGQKPDVSEGTGAENVLFFGSRSQKADHFFSTEWTELRLKLELHVFTAFSRDQKQKIYVQDRIRQQAALVYRLLHDQSGIVYICGSSGKMPQAVREALIEVFQEQGAIEREEAEKELLRMEKDGRYKQETWS
ncbi:MAG: NAPDH-dependent diflavin reductase [Phylliscum demangeonii]|nr:MAG: NAPDH-dependent diflavin reductase [Phylliscum demangeonii]